MKDLKEILHNLNDRFLRELKDCEPRKDYDTIKCINCGEFDNCADYLKTQELIREFEE